MSSELDSTAEINSTYPGRFPRPGGIVVRAEEAFIVIFVLLLWVAAIALFFNRWGKIRMLEPYQPKFQQQHRSSCAIVDSTPLRTCSKINIPCADHLQYQAIGRPRQNSVFLDSGASLLAHDGNFPRRTKSAFDLQSLVQAENTTQEPARVEEEEIEEDQPVMNLKSFNDYPKLSRSFQRERGMSICQFDRTDVLVKPLQRERGMSICHFDRMDVLAYPLQRDKGMSICHFDRMDVLSRPLCRGSRSNIFTNAEKLEALGRSTYHRDSRTSIGNAEGSLKFLHQRAKEFRPTLTNSDRTESVRRNSATMRERPSISPCDRPSCSKTPDGVLGYKATCV
ncbi:uncharacterized protein [Chelonus insularis]|uniref:uncharacterized protein n=1 Tax=Chelonus insularis TaxID=460826 RepID=UPI00158D9074|nr:uncharacterized protein LOC118073238 [Chelonus insularis]